MSEPKLCPVQEVKVDRVNQPIVIAEVVVDKITMELSISDVIVTEIGCSK